MHRATRLLLLVGFLFLVAAPMASAQVLLHNGVGKCLNVEGGVAANGTRLIGFACDRNDRNEMFFFQANGSIQAFSADSNYCVDVAPPAGDDGRVQIWTCNGTQNQRWSYAGGQLRSFNGKCIDLKYGRFWLSGNQPAILYSCNRQDNQQWSRQELRTAQPAPPLPPIVASKPALSAPPNASAAAQLIGTPGAGLVGNSGGTLTSSQPLIGNNGAAGLIGGGGASLSLGNVDHINVLAGLTNNRPLTGGFSAQSAGDPATRVQQAFQTSLGRLPSPAEQSAWVNWINTHAQSPPARSPQGIVEMLRSAVAQPQLGRELRPAMIKQAFAAQAGRAPTGDELAAWNQKVQSNRLVYAELAAALRAAAPTPNARPAPRATAH